MISLDATQDVTLQMSDLQSLIRTVEEGKTMYLKVGVLGDYAGRTPDETGVRRKDSGLTNPEVGLWHEFGSVKRKLPERSFLRMPLMTKLPAELSNVDWAALLIYGGGMFGVLDTIGNKCLQIITQAFATGGFGQWRAWSYRYAKLRERMARAVRRGGRRFVGPVQPGLILVLSGQLQRSVTYAVVRRGQPTTPVMAVE